MIPSAALLPIYALPLLVAFSGWAVHHKLRSARNRTMLVRNRAAGLAEPPGLHPRIDPEHCIGCGACIRACPENDVLGLVGRIATLIEPAACVGHGMCREACPTSAISLVLGTVTRGIAVPVLGPGGETSVPGIHVAGELGGLGLIRNAITQGREVIDQIATNLRQVGPPAEPDLLDVVIVGCGPAGLAASLGAKAHGLNFVALDQASLGGSVAHYPRGKLVMTAPAQLPLIGEVRLGSVSKEELLRFWQDVLQRTALAPRFEEHVRTVEPEASGFVVTTDRARYRTRRVILAMGRGGSPRRLGVPGEDQAKVVYRLSDPGQYAGQKVMIIGGGDAALEAAIALADVSGTRVTLVHRGSAFAGALRENRDAAEALGAAGKINIHMQAIPIAISHESVEIETPDGRRLIANHAVIACLGGTLPHEWLARIGIAIATHHGMPPGQAR
ncbi:NAD(P)-binding domain-containing protein [Novosphingobium sp.]|uniref:NAD(P)-binding domain-containing protein n=1 Tax=Novosphingobium sp. TaxID=1874826 RepID=UPI002626C7D8|nr:NAD(P)-binding domain-containing protein [Novosphingobium sp.]